MTFGPYYRAPVAHGGWESVDGKGNCGKRRALEDEVHEGGARAGQVESGAGLPLVGEP